MRTNLIRPDQFAIVRMIFRSATVLAICASILPLLPAQDQEATCPVPTQESPNEKYSDNRDWLKIDHAKSPEEKATRIEEFLRKHPTSRHRCFVLADRLQDEMNSNERAKVIATSRELMRCSGAWANQLILGHAAFARSLVETIKPDDPNLNLELNELSHVSRCGHQLVSQWSKTPEEREQGQRFFREVSDFVARFSSPATHSTTAVASPADTILTVVSSPGNATVYINDEPKGTTSPEGHLVLRGSTLSDCRVRVGLNGYKDWIQTVHIRPGTPVTVEAKLQTVGPPPFNAQDIVDLLKGGVSPTRCRILVEERGVDFVLDSDAEKKIRDAGGDAELLLAIARGKK